MSLAVGPHFPRCDVLSRGGGGGVGLWLGSMALGGGQSGNPRHLDPENHFLWAVPAPVASWPPARPEAVAVIRRKLRGVQTETSCSYGAAAVVAAGV